MPQEEHTIFDWKLERLLYHVERSASHHGKWRIGLKRTKARAKRETGECRGWTRRRQGGRRSERREECARDGSSHFSRFSEVTVGLRSERHERKGMASASNTADMPPFHYTAQTGRKATALLKSGSSSIHKNA